MNNRISSFLAKKSWALFRRFDVVRFMENLARLEPGAGYAARTGPVIPAFDDQAEVARLAVDLAERSLAGRGEPVGRRELEAQAAIISCRYDAGIHQMLRSSAINIVTGLFGAGSESLERLFLSQDARELANLPRLREARREGRGVVYLINHSSHWDEFIFDAFLDIHGLGLPLFAAGQNMMATPSLGKLLMIGSYVILRTGASRAYLSTLFHYCQALGERGKSQGIFLEAWSGGARTRDGSLRYPRRLIALQGSLAARNDTFVQPVVISYSRIPEDQGLSEGRSLASWLNGHHLIRELVKRPWTPRESLLNGLKGLYGRTYVGLGRGRLASELAAEMERSEGGHSELTLDEYASLFAIREIARDKKIMTTQVASRAFSLLKKTGNLAEAAARAVEEARDYHRRTFGQEPDFEDFFKERGLAAALEDGLESLAARRVIRRGLLSRWTGRAPRILARHSLAYYATHGDRRLYSPSAKENFVVCGSELWALALVSYLGRRTLGDKKYHNSSLTLYDREERVMTALADERTPAALPDQRLPKNVFPTHDHTAAFRKATEVVVAVPPQRMEETLALIMTEARELRSLIIASRGFDPQSHRLTMQIAWETAVAAGRGSINILALSGPFTPETLFLGDDAGGLWTLAGEVRGGRASEALLFKFGKYRVTTSPDPIGVQMAAALADAYALYAALRRPAETGAAPEAAAFLREISAEAKSLSLAMGGQPQTFEADNPAWLAEYLIRAAHRPAPTAAWLTALKNETALGGGSARRELAAQWPEPWANGYFSINSAFITAKHLSLNLPHLEEANKLLWQN
jgi:glycerol-3-phosphate dehydrogenase